MAENSKIEWTDHTFNPWVGCTKLSMACDFCYAEGWAKRTGGAALWQGERRRTSEANWRQPLKWNKKAEAEGRRYRVFCASLADVFDNQVPWEWRKDLWLLIGETPHLDWLLLTKRPQNIAKMLPPGWGGIGWPNVWLGTTVESQVEADRRIPHLMTVPAAVWFLSCEPMLEGFDLTKHFLNPHGFTETPKWVICGGESGPKARPMHPDWARSLRDQCAAAGVPFLFKQWGEYREVFTEQPELIDNDSDRADELYSSAVNPSFIQPDGTHILSRDDLPDEDEAPARLIERIGKARAGRLLDGVEHNGFPLIGGSNV